MKKAVYVKPGKQELDLFVLDSDATWESVCELMTDFLRLRARAMGQEYAKTDNVLVISKGTSVAININDDNHYCMVVDINSMSDFKVTISDRKNELRIPQ